MPYLKKNRHLVVILLLTCLLVLISSTVIKAQTTISYLPQALGITKTIGGRNLTIPDFEKLDLNFLDKYQKSFASKIHQSEQFKEQLNKANFAPLDGRILQSVTLSLLAIADNYWSKAEYSDSNVPTSDYVSGTVTCNGKNVPVAPTAGLAVSYLELTDVAGKNGYYYGKRWISGDQLVEGGCGILKAVNNGKEPTGRLVWGTDAFKIVLVEADERTQQATFNAYMRVCANLPIGGKTCTPYFIPLSWFPVTNNNWVVIGGGLGL